MRTPVVTTALIIALLSSAAPVPAPAEEETPWQPVRLGTGRIAKLGDPKLITVTGGEETADRTVNLVLVLDASGSMNAALPGTGASLVLAASVLDADCDR